MCARSVVNMQLPLLEESAFADDDVRCHRSPLRQQLLKWVGNKQRFAEGIIAFFARGFGTYIEPFLGSGAVLATLAPRRAIASDSYGPLIEIFQTLQSAPETLKEWYTQRWQMMTSGDKTAVFEHIRNSYNDHPNPADLLFLSRACYGGVIRFRSKDGHISTPVGPHSLITPDAFARRVDEWKERTKGTTFLHAEFDTAMQSAAAGDIVYCDPPYSYSQAILYGAQSFSLSRLFEAIHDCKRRGAFVALSIDGSKRSGTQLCSIDIPSGLFVREVSVNVGRSMLKRFQMNGRSLEAHVVTDRLLLTA